MVIRAIWVGEIETIDRENKNGEAFKVINFLVVSKDDEGNKIYTNCSAYGDKGDIPKDFKRGDFCHIDEFHWSIYLEDAVSIGFKKCGELIRVDVL